MIKRINQLLLIVIMLLSLLLPRTLVAAELPVSLQVVLIHKLFPFEQGLSKKEKVSVLVVSEPDIFQAFKLLKIKPGGHDVGQLSYSEELPGERYDIIYINDPTLMKQAKVYAVQYESLVVSGNPEHAKKAVALSLGTYQGKPRFYINAALSEASGLTWHKKILKLATVY